MGKKKKVRVDLRKNRAKPPRKRHWTRGFQEHGFEEEAPPSGERVRAKGDLSRRRTITTDPRQETPVAASARAEMPAVDATDCRPGRVLRVHGLMCVVESDDGRVYRCAVRRLLRTLATDERSIITTGDRVSFRSASGDEGLIERVEPRHGLLTRAARGREHVIVANVDQLAIVMALAEPALKPHLIDRYLASAAESSKSSGYKVSSKRTTASNTAAPFAGCSRAWSPMSAGL